MAIRDEIKKEYDSYLEYSGRIKSNVNQSKVAAEAKVAAKAKAAAKASPSTSKNGNLKLAKEVK
jgi:hypothetical protein